MKSYSSKTLNDQPGRGGDSDPRSLHQFVNTDDEPRKILLIDDDEDFHFAIKTMLSPLGYDIYCAKNEAEALTRIKSIKPCLILIDILMPLVNGINLSKIIKHKHRKHLKNVPIMAVTQSKSMELDEFMTDAHILEIEYKPIDIKSLVCKIEYLLSIH